MVAVDDGTLEDLVEQLGGAGVVLLGLHAGGAMIFNKDGLIEPARHMIQARTLGIFHGGSEEYRWDWQSKSVKLALLIGPPRNTGLICPLYAASQELGDEVQDVFAYALTTEEEQEEQRLISKFDPFDLWVTPEVQEVGLDFLRLAAVKELEDLKKQGNQAFKAGKADLAFLYYHRAKA